MTSEPERAVSDLEALAARIMPDMKRAQQVLEALAEDVLDDVRSHPGATPHEINARLRTCDSALVREILSELYDRQLVTYSQRPADGRRLWTAVAS